MNIQNRELIIDPELSSLIPPLTPEEYEGLKDSVKQYGFRPERGLIITWNNIIIDGHNRYKICLELEEETGKTFLDIQAHTHEMDNLTTKEDVIIWMYHNQLGKRNLTAAARINLALKVESMLREKAKANLATSTGGSNPQPLLNSTKAGKTPINTRREIAKMVSKSEDTVRKVKLLKENAAPELFEEVLSGRKSIHAGYLEMKSGTEGLSLESLTNPEPKIGFSESDSSSTIDGKLSNNTAMLELESTLKAFSDNIYKLIDSVDKTPLSKTEQDKILPLIQQTKNSLDKLTDAVI
jgi:hypothetical protein